MRKGLIWLGIVAIVFGLFLPWLEANSILGSATANGLSFGDSVINLIIGGVSLFISFVAGRSDVSARLSGLVLIMAGAILAYFSYDTLQQISQTKSALAMELFGWQREVMQLQMSTGPGVFVTMAGGAILALAGIGYLFGGEDD